MNAVIFGASGMVGGAVLRECLEDPDVASVLVVGRRTCELTDPKLRELLLPALFDLKSVADDLTGLDACFYCLGVSSAGMSEEAYRRVTYDLTVAVADALEEASPELVMCFVSGQGTDSSAAGRIMWARVKGEAENHLLERPMKAYMFRPGFIQPLKGVRSKVRMYNALYAVTKPLFPVVRRLLPGVVTDSVTVGRAMIRAAREGAPKPILETSDINELGGLGRTRSRLPPPS